MGFNKRILPDIGKLQNMVFDHGLEWVVEKYSKADMLMGSVESQSYYQNLIREYESKLGK